MRSLVRHVSETGTLIAVLLGGLLGGSVACTVAVAPDAFGDPAGAVDGSSPSPGSSATTSVADASTSPDGSAQDGSAAVDSGVDEGATKPEGPESGDWATRIAGASVVWFHNFDSKAEVDQFRWTNGYSGGQDPLAKGPGGSFVAWQASGGANGGGFMRLTYPLGAVDGRGSSYWARPFTPLTATTNGRGAADPGASGTIATQAFEVSDGAGTLVNWGAKASNPGWYGSPTDQNASPSKYQGNDFYLQVRVRRNGNPGAPPDSAQYSYITGKSVWLTTTNSSYTPQELVTYGQSVSNQDTAGSPSRHMIYDGQNFSPIDYGQPNLSVALSNSNLSWRYSGGWDTLLYHVTPGTPGGTGTNRTRVEVWAQHDPTQLPSESGKYTKIWDTIFSQSYDTGTNSVGAPALPGWNALILAIYHNGSAFTTSSFSFDYDQVIFSKATIPAPIQ